MVSSHVGIAAGPLLDLCTLYVLCFSEVPQRQSSSADVSNSKMNNYGGLAALLERGSGEITDALQRMMPTAATRAARIKWYEARWVFFELQRFAVGLELARQSSCDEAVLLVSLFPAGIPSSLTHAKPAFLAKPDDSRCQCWAALCEKPENAEARVKQLLKSADGGYAWAQALFADQVRDWREKQKWLILAAVQGEPKAISISARETWNARGRSSASEFFLREAAALGEPSAQFYVAEMCCPKSSGERFVWLRRAAEQGYKTALSPLLWTVKERFYGRVANSSPRAVYELAVGMRDARVKKIVLKERGNAPIANWAWSMYDHWTAHAKTGVLCWIWAGRQLGVSRDMRRMIADLVWAERAEWSVRPEGEALEEIQPCGSESSELEMAEDAGY